MAGEANKAVVRRVFEEVFKQGDLEVVDELVATNFVSHNTNPLPNQPLRGPEAVRWYARLVHGGFPDYQVVLDDMLSEGNEVAVRFTVTGTHTGQFGYLAPTGKKIHILGIDLLGVEDGKLVSLWGGWNIAEMMVQLGFFPTAEGTQW